MKKNILSLLFLILLIGNVSGATFTVTNTNDNGTGSLRQAINDAVGTAAPPHNINFNITPVAATYTITLNSALNINGGQGSQLIIDATTQPGWAPANTPIVIIRGNGGTNAGFNINGGGAHSIKGFVLQNFTQYGISITNGTGSNTIQNCYFGVGADGLTTAGNAINDYGI